MAKPMTPNQLLAALKAEGLTVVEYIGWRDRCRCHSGSHEKNIGWLGNTASRGWGDVNGTLTHITAGGLGGGSVESYIARIINGDPNVLCKAQFVIAPNGVVYLNSAGRSNHAGTVGSDVRAHMIVADFSLSDDFDNRFTGGAVDGNAFTYGIENIGVGYITAAQRTASVKVNAAIARHYAWGGRESVGHGEVSNRRGKADPNLHMGDFRRAVIARVKAGAGTSAPKTNPQTLLEEIMSTASERKAFAEEVAAAVWEHELASRNKDANEGKLYAASDHLTGNNANIWELVRGTSLTAADITAAVKAGIDSKIDTATVNLSSNE